MKVTAVICVRNGEAYAERCLQHLVKNGIEIALIDHESADRTMEKTALFARHIVHVDRMPWEGHFDLTKQLEAKMHVMRRLRSDWWIHQDIDEILVSNRPGESLTEALQRVDLAGYDVVNFDEFVFVPENESVRYENKDYVKAMHYYYFFEPRTPRLMRAWKSRAGLSFAGGGHLLKGDVLLNPMSFPLRHYMHLSWKQVVEKYPGRKFAPTDLKKGWHGNRLSLTPDALRLPSLSCLKRCETDNLAALDKSDPKKDHFWEW